MSMLMKLERTSLETEGWTLKYALLARQQKVRLAPSPYLGEPRQIEKYWHE